MVSLSDYADQLALKFSRVGQAVSLTQLLDAREARARLQTDYRQQYQTTVLSVTLVAMGEVKNNPLLAWIFAKLLDELTAYFTQSHITPLARTIRPLPTGHEAIFAIPMDALVLKKAMIALEDTSPLGRLWDIDVISATGELISRQQFGFSERQCLVCDQPARHCARARQHTLDELYRAITQKVTAVDFAQYCANAVHHALLTEVQLSPKPGLVDSQNNGAHQDMDRYTFEQSANALFPFWAKFVDLGMTTAHLPSKHILAHIRPLGVQAEQAMFNATQHINTHKGAIFAFGLICTALGRLWLTARATLFSPNAIHAITDCVAQFCQGICQELSNPPPNTPLTAGIKAFQQWGLTGARGEAEQGFPLVRLAYQHYQSRLVALQDTQHQQLISLLWIMAHNPDTNVVHRGGMAGLQFVQDYANALLKDEQIFNDKAWLITQLTEFDQQCIQQHLSAGGSADLLAITLFFISLRGSNDII